LLTLTNAGRLAPQNEVAAAINAISKMPEWLFEGGHRPLTKPLFETASAIIWLDIPLRVTLWRRFKRFRGKPLRFQIGQVFWQVQSYYRSDGPDDSRYPSQAALSRFLSQHGSRVLRYRRTPAVNQVIRDLEYLNA
jgi:hypothetical protein